MHKNLTNLGQFAEFLLETPDFEKAITAGRLYRSWHIGPVLMGAAIWRSGALWRWGGLLLIIDGVLSIPGFVLDMKVLSNFAATVGGIGLIAFGSSLFQSVRGRSEK